MKKHIVIISGILQFVAVIMYLVVVKSVILLIHKEISFISVALIMVIAITAQVLSIKLKGKYKNEVKKAEEIMQKPKTSYGWIALGIFCLIVLFFIIYTKFFLN